MVEMLSLIHISEWYEDVGITVNILKMMNTVDDQQMFEHPTVQELI
jgi:hypothetical protein